ncbi:hypothetical protein B0H10DRAFT_2226259 [Mycena sp. CBHHK59/15]|nr:hypothetical protein B0H10DRAFT_2226259 [Mycena sp. CBHHK59/15]
MSTEDFALNNQDSASTTAGRGLRNRAPTAAIEQYNAGEAKKAESRARRKPRVPQTAASAGFTSVGAGHAGHPSASMSPSSPASVFAPEAGPQLFSSMQPPAYALTPNQSHYTYPRHDQ